jgi:hypothetical protein
MFTGQKNNKRIRSYVRITLFYRFLRQTFVSREKRIYKNKAAKDNPTSNPIQIPAAFKSVYKPK